MVNLFFCLGVHVQIIEFRGKELLDIRVYYLSDDNEFHPTKKGIAIFPDLVDEFYEAINKAREAIEAMA